VDDRKERAARNEAMYRAVNLEVERVSEEIGGGPNDRLEILCECGQEACGATLDGSRAEYEEAHQQRDRFMVAPGHEDEQIEHVVKRTPEYLIVDKFGEAERVAEAEERREGRPDTQAATRSLGRRA
jgi:hypothetical protein